MKTDSTIVLQIRNKLSELSLVTDQVVSLIDRYKLSKKQAHDIFLVIDEILSNIINYAYDDGNEHFIDIELTVNQQMFRLITKDDGMAFDMTKNKAVDTTSKLDERDIGGLGLFFVKNIVDKMEYTRENNKNVLIMEKIYAGKQTSSKGN